MSQRLNSACCLLAAALLAPAMGAAQSAGEGAGPLSELSTHLGDGRLPAGHGAPTIGEASAGPMTSGPVREPRPRTMLSGPVSEVSRGPVRASTSNAPAGGPVAAHSVGAVTKDHTAPLGARISDPLHELAPLRERLRALYENAE
jgi:hypothetical protein